MNRKVLVFSVAAAIVALSIVPSAVSLDEGFLPPNDMSIPVDSLQAKGITEKQFNDVMDQIQSLYGPVVAAHGGTLVIKRRWDNGMVNAYAERIGSDYIIHMYGGLARHEAVTQDGMALVACHELGHHIGGAPKKWGNDWASNEGQADYFANLKCLRRVFASPGAASFTRLAGEEDWARAACQKSYSQPVDRDICVRASMAGMSVTTLMRMRRNEAELPRFETPDPNVVSETIDLHPGTQCRLDTYVAGSLCARPVDEEVSESDPAPGTCTRSEERVGLRPRCWYKPPAGKPVGFAEVAARPAPRAPALMSFLNQANPWKGF